MTGVDEAMLSQDRTRFCTPGVEAPLDRPVWDSGIDILLRWTWFWISSVGDLTERVK